MPFAVGIRRYDRVRPPVDTLRRRYPADANSVEAPKILTVSPSAKKTATGRICAFVSTFTLASKSVFEKVDSHGIGVVIHGVSESTTRDECRCPAASAVPIRAT